MTQAVANAWPCSSKSTPHGLLVPSAKTSNSCRVGMIAPDAGVERHALVVGRAGLADLRVREDAVAAVEPAVRSPGEGVQRLVRVLVAPAVEQDLRRAVGLVVAVRVGNEQQVRRRADPDAAEADLEAADEIQSFGEDRALVEACRRRPCPRRSGCGRGPCRPRARAWDTCTPRRPRAGRGRRSRADRVHDVGLRGDELDGEALRHRHRLGRLGGREPGVQDRVDRRQGAYLRRGDLGGEERARFVEAEVIERDVRPRALFQVGGDRGTGLVVHQPDGDVLAGMSPSGRRRPAASRHCWRPRW